jgi:hypothetical protein
MCCSPLPGPRPPVPFLLTTRSVDAPTPPVILSTGTGAEPTHWKQTVLWLDPSRRIAGVCGDKISGTIGYMRSHKNDRDYEIALAWRVESASAPGAVAELQSQKYILGAS